MQRLIQPPPWVTFAVPAEMAVVFLSSLIMSLSLPDHTSPEKLLFATSPALIWLLLNALLPYWSLIRMIMA